MKLTWLPADRSAWNLLLIAGGFELSLGGVAMFLGWMFDVDVFATLKGSATAWGIGLAGTVPMVLLLWAILRWPVGPMGKLVDNMRQLGATVLSPCGVLGLAVLSVCAGVGEELLTRGFVHTVALQYLSPVSALFVTGLVFGLMHPISRAYICVAGVIGVYLGWIWTLSGPDMVAPFVAHALYDFIALVVICLSVKKPRQRGSGAPAVQRSLGGDVSPDTGDEL